MHSFSPSTCECASCILTKTGIKVQFGWYNLSMVIILTKKATPEEIKKMGHEYGNYIKVVVDLEKGILAGGAAMHYDEEQVLLEYGCKQENLWGGGIDLETGEVMYDSMINIRPKQGNSKREIESEQIRGKLKKIVMQLI